MNALEGLMCFFVCVAVILFCGCQARASTNIPTSTITPTSLPRWMIYEVALSKAIVKKKDGLCEWEIWGRSGNEVYVWALCKVQSSLGTAGSVPAVVHLGDNGEIEKIVIPRDGYNYSVDVQALFPVDVQKKIFNLEFDGVMAEKHIDERLESHGPPLVVVLGTPMP